MQNNPSKEILSIAENLERMVNARAHQVAAPNRKHQGNLKTLINELRHRVGACDYYIKAHNDNNLPFSALVQESIKEEVLDILEFVSSLRMEEGIDD